MLAQKYKLHLRQEHDFFSQSQRVKFRSFLLYFQPSETSQAIVIVPKRVSALSTTRYRSKRLLYSALENNWSNILIKKVALAFVVTKNIELPEKEQLEKDLATWIEQIEVQ